MSSGTRQEVLKNLRRRYQGAGPAYRRKLIDQAVEVLGYHRKSAIRALGSTEADRIRPVNTGRPRRYEAGKLTPWLRPIWQATDYACGRRLAAILSELLLRRGRDLGFGRVLVWTTPDNERAIAFYERMGFQRCGSVPRDVGLLEKFVSLARPPLPVPIRVIAT